MAPETAVRASRDFGPGPRSALRAAPAETRSTEPGDLQDEDRARAGPTLAQTQPVPSGAVRLQGPAWLALGAILLSGCSGLAGPSPPLPAASIAYEPAAGCADFAREAPHGSFVLYLPGPGRWLVCDPDRAREGFLPASTFKVSHALIALETGAVSEASEMFEWDGRPRRVAAWNRSGTLADGMQGSIVWIYQAVARRVGWDRERAWVRRLEYGNGEIGREADLTRFWLDGDLRTSAIQQVEFLDRLRRGTLPVSADTQAAVRRMMATASPADAPGETVYAKSGAVLAIDPVSGDLSDAPELVERLAGQERTGWYVGWIDGSGDADAVFALNMRLETSGDLARREPLARALLAANRDARRMSTSAGPTGEADPAPRP